MSKIFNTLRKINKGGVVATGVVGGILSWVWAYEKVKESKRRNIIVSDKILDLAKKVKDEIGDDYVDVHELAKDMQQRKNDAEQVKQTIKNLKNNIKDD